MSALRQPDVLALFLPEVKELIDRREFAQLKELLKKLHALDLAEGWRYLSEQEKVLTFKLLSARRAILIFEHLPLEEQSFLLDNLENEAVSQVLNEMASDERVELFKDLSSRAVRKLFTMMRKEEVDDVRKLLTYEEGTAGSLMTTEFVELKKEMSARRAIIRLQEFQRAGQSKDIHTVYVTDDNHCLRGGVSLQQLITAPPDMSIRELISSMEQIKVHCDTDEEEVARHFTKYDPLDVPVVDSDNRLLGIITVDDVVDLIHREATEDIYGMGKISGVASAAEISYRRASIFTLVRERLLWLFVLLCVGVFISGRLLKGYSGAVLNLAILVPFIPMLMDSGGNSGQQANCMVVRALATGDVHLREMGRAIRKEVAVGLLMGLLLGLLGAASTILIQKGLDVRLALTVGLSLFSIVTLATVTGTFLPFFFKKIGLDPAVAASPFITTIVDATTIVVYFTVARKILI